MMIGFVLMSPSFKTTSCGMQNLDADFSFVLDLNFGPGNWKQVILNGP